MNKKSIIKIATYLGLTISQISFAHSEVYLTIDQAKHVMWQDQKMKKIDVSLSKEQMKSIQKASKTRVSRSKMHVWKTSNGGWFIVDQVVGKHEMIDFAIALDKNGKVKDIEILTYRETYGSEVKHPKWLAQFFGKSHKDYMKVTKNVKNISGATLSSVHITEGVNRITHSWDQILRHL